ncbi:lipopolysaccharide biosynthesis protein [Aquirufa antheringensis]|uniref:lipopolysaccharide biosynthesis protein n=1 Tax=Aquirufa antheringensis TaxID=2516559 RepID=UPI0022A96E97|nr:polysaccharide biosynthesis C-terminal domain-containing protein [Aquirufa antheringensis]MCZ2484742.1 hypothetical protein [Aquirufa antheringensis]
MSDNYINSEKSNIIDKIVKFSIPSIASFVVNILSAIIVTRHLSPSDYGLINTFIATTSFMMSIASLGLDSGFIRYYFDLPKSFDRNELFITSLIIPSIILLSVALVLTIFFYQKISVLIFGFESKYLILILFINVFASIVIRFTTILVRMEGNTFLYSVLIIGTQLALKGALIFAAIINPRLLFALNSIVFSMLFVVILFVIKYSYKFKISNFSVLEKISNLFGYFKYSFYSWPVPSLLYFNALVTLLIIRVNIGNVSVGVFSSVSIFVGLIGVLQTGFSTFWSGYMFENYNEKQNQIKRINSIVLYLSVLLLINFVLFKDLIYYLIGENFHETKSYFAIILISPILLILTETTSYGISIAKKSGILLIITISTILINLILTWILIPKFGILGAAIASSLSSLTFFISQTHIGQYYYSSVFSTSKVYFTVFVIFIIAFANFYFDMSFGILVMICGGVFGIISFLYAETVGLIYTFICNKFRGICGAQN